jgi:uncharacterized protein YjcR
VSADWTAIKTEYVHGTDTMRELAEKHGIKAAGLMRRAANEGWDAERKQKSAEVSKTVSDSLVSSRAEDLAKFNADDLMMARAIRAKAAKLMANANTPADLRALAGAVDTAQKVGRLALGASTENSSVTTKELPASVDEFV